MEMKEGNYLLNIDKEILIPEQIILEKPVDKSVFSSKFTDTKNFFNVLPEELKRIANQRNQMNGLDLLAMFNDCSVPAVFFDPQYRGVMDKMSYGNEGAEGSRQKERAELSQMPEEVITQFFKEINRVLKPSGHLLLWIDKFHLVEGFSPWVAGTDLQIVDMITWDKGRIGMGYRTRRKSEYLVVLQKAPKRAKGSWILHNIPDVWSEKIKAVHTHSKPELLQSAIIEAIVPLGDFVLDPASGGFSVMRSAKAIGRNFIGADLRG